MRRLFFALCAFFVAVTVNGQEVPAPVMVPEAWVDLGEATVSPDKGVSGEYGTWTVTYTVGEGGIAAGGGIRVQLPDEWHAGPRNSAVRLQTTDPKDENYITASTSNSGVAIRCIVEDERDNELIKHAKKSLDGRSERYVFVVRVLVTEGALQAGGHHQRGLWRYVWRQQRLLGVRRVRATHAILVSLDHDDTPYSRFVQEQLASDVLFPSQGDLLPALGFVAAGPWDFIGHVEVSAKKADGRIARYLDRDDMVVNTMQTFCSVTVGCARCHNHKFDPITQEDYYSLQSVFAGVGRNDVAYGLPAEVVARKQKLSEDQESLAKQIALLEERSKNQAAGNQAAKELAEELAQNRQELTRVQEEIAQLPAPKVVYAVATNFVAQGNHLPHQGKMTPIHVLMRGQIDAHGELTGPGALRLPKAPSGRFELPEGHTEGARRAALARWITDRSNPLTWRSIVNRMWHYHFGQGICATPNDLGRMGALPTHPELLDWLAVEFRDGGQWITVPQSLKQLHRLIVTSAAYRQSSINNARFAAIDQGNQFLWRQQRRRLEAEAIRDATLMVAGKLDRKMYGPGFRDFVIEQAAHSPQFAYEKYDPDDPSTLRRSIYRFLPRSQPQPFMEALDCADPSQQVARRDETVTPLSALALLNNRFMVRMAEHFATRVESEFDTRGQQIDAAFRSTVNRQPSAEERAALLEHARAQGMASMCRVLLNLNEFVFVD